MANLCKTSTKKLPAQLYSFSRGSRRTLKHYNNTFFPSLIPGAVQQSAIFVHAQSFEDLTAETETKAEAGQGDDSDKSEECTEELQVLVGEKTVEEQRNRDVSPESKSKEEDVSSEAWRSHRKHVFVLSEAGKPIYTRYGSEEALSSTMGVMMALVSVVEAGKNIIRSIHAGQNIIFPLRCAS